MLRSLFQLSDFNTLSTGKDIETTIQNTQSQKSILLLNITPYFFSVLDDGQQLVGNVPPFSIGIAPIHPGSIGGSGSLTITSDVNLPTQGSGVSYSQWAIQYSLSPIEQPFSLTQMSVSQVSSGVASNVNVTNSPNIGSVASLPAITFNGAQPVNFNGVAQPVTLSGTSNNVDVKNTSQMTSGIQATNQLALTANTAAQVSLAANLSSIALTNMNTSGVIYVGASGVTTSNGFPIQPGQTVEFDCDPTAASYTIYAIAAAASTLGVLEVK